VKVNVDESPNTPQQYNVRGIPTLIAFKNGEVVSQLVGNQPRETIRSTFEAVV
jgi:thioredoxin 1